MTLPREFVFFISCSIVTLSVMLSACASQPVYRVRSEPFETVASVDLARYVGRWYETHRAASTSGSERGGFSSLHAGAARSQAMVARPQKAERAAWRQEWRRSASQGFAARGQRDA